jgi:hypothetical protein
MQTMVPSSGSLRGLTATKKAFLACPKIPVGISLRTVESLLLRLLGALSLFDLATNPAQNHM